MTDRRWRRRIEAMERAGLEYIDRRRVSARPTTIPTSAAEPGLQSAAAAESGVPGDQEMSQSLRAAALKLLSEEVSRCTRCSVLAERRTQTVFSDGSPTAELCFVGEAPGADEDRQGVPFVGKAGQLLTKIIEACKLRRDEVYICNVLKCRPPDNRNPSPDEVCNCRPFLERQIDLLRPKMLVALGKYAAAYLLDQRPEDTPITRLRGQVREYRGIPVMITLHPAYLLRNPPAKKDVWEDMKEVMRRLGRPVE